MKKSTMSRRTALKAGPYALAAAAAMPSLAGASAEGGLSPDKVATIRKYYSAWETADWRPFNKLLADDFTFTSANDDDHISKSAFKTRCWETQKNFIDHFDLLHVFGSGNEALVLYVGHTKNGKTFRNVEYLRLADTQLETIECYFGASASFASAVATDRK